ncbi:MULTISPECIES: response regulator transcription factor [Catenuloplanes]|uniref:Two-component system OmpR family response regulator n=1 Tax=Catenuloplanes niger TaxID=587534 RepID=A0AAE3ZPI3_9ACTN|nr:response regulator transcription factor [Catenuloplanes niger]MDR7322400.1 two-component system OmpR family response regulator [Catenuloplanes niger]
MEDEPALRELVSRTLGFAGLPVLSVSTVQAAIDAVADTAVAVAVLDVMLPDGSGLDLAQRLRAERSAIGVLFLTARDSLEDRLTGFAFGADDYLTKPFSVAELIARVTALHRRVLAGTEGRVREDAQAASGTMTVGDVTLDESTYAVTRAGRPLELSPTEFKLLRYLMSNADVVVSKDQIVAQVWQYDFAGDSGVVEKFISQLRRKLDATGDSFIRTVRGFGYTVRTGEPGAVPR